MSPSRTTPKVFHQLPVISMVLKQCQPWKKSISAYRDRDGLFWPALPCTRVHIQARLLFSIQSTLRRLAGHGHSGIGVSVPGPAVSVTVPAGECEVSLPQRADQAQLERLGSPTQPRDLRRWWGPERHAGRQYSNPPKDGPDSHCDGNFDESCIHRPDLYLR